MQESIAFKFPSLNQDIFSKRKKKQLKSNLPSMISHTILNNSRKSPILQINSPDMPSLYSNTGKLLRSCSRGTEFRFHERRLTEIERLQSRTPEEKQ